MPAAAVSYFNRIDLGIYLCILEVCMEQGKIGFDRALFTDNGGRSGNDPLREIQA